MPAGEWPHSFAAISAFGFELSQSAHNWVLQKKQPPHAMGNGTTTRSPIFKFVTAEPNSTTSPMNSCPRTSPRMTPGIMPSYRCRSEPQIAVDVIFTIASRGLRI
jgi:hypothetical protein